MQFIPFVLVLEAMLSGTVMMGDSPIGGTVTFHNDSVTISQPLDSQGKYSIAEVPAGTYHVTIRRRSGGRQKSLMFSEVRVMDGANTVDLWWPSEEGAEARTALVRGHFNAGKAAYGAGNYSEAAQHFRAAVQEDCSQHASWSALSLALASAGDQPGAMAAHRSAKAWGAGSESCASIANAFLAARRYADAGRMYAEAAAVNPSKAAMYHANAGAAYYSGGMHAQAAAAYKASANSAAAPASSWYFWGVCAQSAGQNADALTGLRGYIRVEPNGRYAADARQRIAALGG